MSECIVVNVVEVCLEVFRAPKWLPILWTQQTLVTRRGERWRQLISSSYLCPVFRAWVVQSSHKLCLSVLALAIHSFYTAVLNTSFVILWVFQNLLVSGQRGVERLIKIHRYFFDTAFLKCFDWIFLALPRCWALTWNHLRPWPPASIKLQHERIWCYLVEMHFGIRTYFKKKSQVLQLGTVLSLFNAHQPWPGDLL